MEVSQIPPSRHQNFVICLLMGEENEALVLAEAMGEGRGEELYQVKAMGKGRGEHLDWVEVLCEGREFKYLNRVQKLDVLMYCQ